MSMTTLSCTILDNLLHFLVFSALLYSNDGYTNADSRTLNHTTFHHTALNRIDTKPQQHLIIRQLIIQHLIKGTFNNMTTNHTILNFSDT